MDDNSTVNVFHNYDSVIIISTLLLTFSCLFLMVLPISDAVSEAGDATVIITHAWILPSIYLASNTRWLSVSIALTALVSLTYHAAKLSKFEKDLLLHFQMADESAQAVLIWLSAILFIYDDFPFLGVPFLFFVGILVAVFGDYTILSMKFDSFVVGIAILLTLLFLLYKLFLSKCNFNTTFFRYKRVWEFITIGFGFFILATLFYMLASDIENYEGEKKNNNYNFLHSGWHLCAYTALFFIFRSRVKPLNTLLTNVRIKRTQFAMKN